MKIIVDDLAVEYLDEGSGAPILMLHGWADSLHTWDPVVKGLSGYRIVRLDLPGFGDSERPKSTWDVGEYAHFISMFCKRLQYDPEILIGHSFGGRIAIKGVGTGVLNPKKVILIASAGVARRKTLRNAILRVVAKTGKGITHVPPFSFWRNSIRKRLYAKIGSDYFAAGSMRGTFLKVIGEDLIQCAQYIKLPTLIIWGRDDKTTVLSEGERIHTAIQNSRLEVIEGAGHFVHREKPNEVARMMREFCI